MAKKKQSGTPEELLEQALVPESEQPYEVPDNWVWTYFSNVCKFENGYAFKSADYKDSGIPLIRISNICDGQVDLSNCIYIKNENIDARFIVRRGDLLIAMSGATTGKNGIYKMDSPAYLNQRVGNIKIIDANVLIEGFRNLYLMDKNQEILNNAYGGAQPNISATDIGYMQFPLPPIAEQQRIVDRIGSLFEKLDQAKGLIQDALDSFENRKAAILHKAFSGELTRKWREENGVSANETFEQVLFHYKNTSTLKHIKLIEELQEHYEHIVTIENSVWYKCKLGAVAVVTNGSTPSRQVTEYWNGKIPWVSSGEVRNNIITDTRERITELGYDMSSVKLLPTGTVLMAMIGEGKTRGQSAILSIEATINQNIAAIDLSHNTLVSKFVWYWLQRQYQSNREAGNGTGPQALNCQKVRELDIVIPPYEEQIEIVRILDEIIASEDRAKELYDLIIGIDHMKKTILARAFRGELRTNDPVEESSLELLKEVLGKVN